MLKKIKNKILKVASCLKHKVKHWEWHKVKSGARTRSQCNNQVKHWNGIKLKFGLAQARQVKIKLNACKTDERSHTS